MALSAHDTLDNPRERRAVWPVYVPERWNVAPDGLKRLAVAQGEACTVFTASDCRATGLLTGGDELPLSAVLGAPGGLAGWALAARVGLVLLLPDETGELTPALRPAAVLEEASAGRLSAHPLTVGRGGESKITGVIAQASTEDGKGRGAVVTILAPLVSDGWGLGSRLDRLPLASRPRVAASAFMLASYALDVRLRFTPSHAGLTVLREELARWQVKGLDLSPLPASLRSILTDHKPTPVTWARPIGADEGERHGDRLAVWKYDRNASYVSSAREVPTGEPRVTREFAPKAPGLYLVDAIAPGSWPHDLPGPIATRDQGDDLYRYPHAVRQTWAWAPQVALAMMRGWRVTIHHGLAWDGAPVTDNPHGPLAGRKHDLFRSWQERIWGARRSLAAMVDRSADDETRTAAQCAGAIVKRAGLAAIGRLNQQRGRAMVTLDEADAAGLDVRVWELDPQGIPTGLVEVSADLGRADLVRPEWWGTIIAQANTRLLEAAYRARMQHGVPVVGLYVDALYTLAPVPDLDGDTLKTGGWRLERAALPRHAVLDGRPLTLATETKHAPLLTGMTEPDDTADEDTTDGDF